MLAVSKSPFIELSLSAPRLNYALSVLVGLHIFIICLSNYLVQIPVTIFSLNTTWGAFSFPLIFLATDLTVRLLGKKPARLVIAKVMLPALLISYIFSSLFADGKLQNLTALFDVNIMVLRITLASFSAYVIGQLLDIYVFGKLRRSSKWWLAPSCSGVLGGAIDTLVFFSIAFWRSSDEFMAQNWIEIGSVDYGVKLLALLLFMLPAYGTLLNFILRKIKSD